MFVIDGLMACWLFVDVFSWLFLFVLAVDWSVVDWFPHFYVYIVGLFWEWSPIFSLTLSAGKYLWHFNIIFSLTLSAVYPTGYEPLSSQIVLSVCLLPLSSSALSCASLLALCASLFALCAFLFALSCASLFLGILCLELLVVSIPCAITLVIFAPHLLPLPLWPKTCLKDFGFCVVFSLEQ